MAGEKILLVEDNSSIRTVVGDYLEEIGYEVHRAEDGDTALAMLQNDTYHLVLLDIDIPGMKGPELFEYIKEHTPPTQTIFITGNDSLDEALTLLREGAADYLTKPFSEELLRETIQKTLQKQSISYKKDLLIKQLLKKTKKMESVLFEKEKRLSELRKAKESLDKQNLTIQTLNSTISELKEELKKKDEELKELKKREKELEQKDSSILSQLKQGGIAYPSPLYAITNNLALICALVCFAGGIYFAFGKSLSHADFSGRYAFLNQTLLIALLLLEFSTIVKLFSIISYFKKNITSDTEPSLLERFHTNVPFIAAVTSSIFIGLVAGRMFLTVKKAEAQGLGAKLLAYTSNVSMLLTMNSILLTASFLLLGGILSGVYLLHTSYRAMLEQRLQRRSAKKLLNKL